MVSKQFYVEFETEEIAGGRGFMLSVVPTRKILSQATVSIDSDTCILWYAAEVGSLSS